MRSSKSRSRSKSNRPRSIGNIVNRVFDSSGPEGKVRGTPQQIIEKYLILARDAQLSNDRVSAENFMQHAEHYTRMLAEAQRELAAEQEQRRPQGENGQGGSQGGYQQSGQVGVHVQQPRDNQYRDRPYRDERSEPRDEQVEVPAPRASGLMDFIDELTDNGLVETPETRVRTDQPQPMRTEFADRRDRGPRAGEGDRPERRREDRKPRDQRQDEAVRVAPEQPAASDIAPSAPAAAEPVSAKRPRAPRKPRGEAPSSGGDGPAEAAE
jgi:hypothetical protein